LAVVQAPSRFDAAADRLVRAFAAFGVVPAAVVAILVAVLLAPLWGIVAFVLIALAWVAVVVVRARGSLGRVLDATGARPGTAGSQPRWENIVTGLGLSSGVADPELWYLDVAAANAAVLVAGDRVVLVATTGLLDSLSAVEQEAVCANLLCRVRDGSARYATLTAGFLGGLTARVEGADRLVADGLGAQRAVQSDLAAVGLTRYPPGLARALAAMAERGTELPSVDACTSHVWIAPVAVDTAPAPTAVTETAQQPLDLRVAVLDEL
jgi:Zn-dependent protease with chaperone function